MSLACVKKTKISVVLPCRNEERALPICIYNIREALKNHDHEIIVSDSSTDDSPAIAKALKTTLIKHDKLGYGLAYRESFKHITGDYILMGDADATYNYHDFIPMIQKLDEGYDLVVGNRFSRRKNKSHMPFLHWNLGNPFLTFLMRRRFRIPIHDTQCGIRAVRRAALENIRWKSPGMEFASEMIIKLHLAGFKITETPVHYLPRVGVSKLRPVSDGLRHVRVILGTSSIAQTQCQ
jgi:glycosyltransferase involved in cell wall biosynthesis